MRTTDETRFRQETVPGEPSVRLEPAAFFALPEETLVEARGTWSGTVLTAEYAIVKTCDDWRSASCQRWQRGGGRGSSAPFRRRAAWRGPITSLTLHRVHSGPATCA